MRNSPIHLAATMVKLMILWSMSTQTNEIMIRRQSEQINKPISHRFEAEFAKLAMKKHIALQIREKKSYLREKVLYPIAKPGLNSRVKTIKDHQDGTVDK